MTGAALTREECQRLSGLVRLGLKAGLFGVQYEDFLAIADLVESYALPPEDGERAEIARLLERLSGDWPHAPGFTRTVMLAPIERERCATAAALLRQPVARVSKEEVGALVAALRSVLAGCTNELERAGAINVFAAAVEALPEPEPPAPLAGVSAGVSKEAVVALVKQFGSEAMTDAPAPGLRPMTGYDFTQAVGHLVSDIESLPEAAPKERGK